MNVFQRMLRAMHLTHPATTTTTTTPTAVQQQ